MLMFIILIHEFLLKHLYNFILIILLLNDLFFLIHHLNLKIMFLHSHLKEFNIQLYLVILNLLYV